VVQASYALLGDASKEKVHQLADAHVIWADYSTLKALNLIKNLPSARTKSQIDQWILNTFAFISNPHVEDNLISEKAQITSISKTALRPPNYDRTVVIEARGQLFDVKGAGLPPGRVPENKEHGTGLLPAFVAIAEVYAERCIKRILSRTLPYSTIPTLAVIGTQIKTPLLLERSYSIRTALLVRPHSVRQFSTGDYYPVGSQLAAAQYKIERKLRQYGLTSCDVRKGIELTTTSSGNVSALYNGTKLSGPQQESLIQFLREAQIPLSSRIEILNIQFGVPATQQPKLCLIDFEQYTYRNRFEFPLGHLQARNHTSYIDITPLGAKEFIRTPFRRDAPSIFLSQVSVPISRWFDGADESDLLRAVEISALDLEFERLPVKKIRRTLENWISYADNKDATTPSRLKM